MVSRLAAKFAFFPPSPATYQVMKREDGRLVAVSSSMPIPLADDSSLDVLLIDTKRGSKIVAFYLRNPYARLTLLYSHGNAADLGQLYDLFNQLKVNLRVNLMGLVLSSFLLLFFFGFSNGQSTGKLCFPVFFFSFLSFSFIDFFLILKPHVVSEFLCFFSSKLVLWTLEMVNITGFINSCLKFYFWVLEMVNLTSSVFPLLSFINIYIHIYIYFFLKWLISWFSV